MAALLLLLLLLQPLAANSLSARLRNFFRHFPPKIFSKKGPKVLAEELFSQKTRSLVPLPTPPLRVESSHTWTRWLGFLAPSRLSRYRTCDSWRAISRCLHLPAGRRSRARTIKDRKRFETLPPPNPPPRPPRLFSPPPSAEKTVSG